MRSDPNFSDLADTFTHDFYHFSGEKLKFVLVPCMHARVAFFSLYYHGTQLDHTYTLSLAVLARTRTRRASCRPGGGRPSSPPERPWRHAQGAG